MLPTAPAAPIMAIELGEEEEVFMFESWRVKVDLGYVVDLDFRRLEVLVGRVRV